MELIRIQRARRAGFSCAVGAGLLSILHRLSSGTETGRPESRALHAIPVTRAMDFIESHLHQAIALDEVAAHLDLNPAYLARVFKADTGESVGQLVARRKMELARERMLTTRMSIKAVAHSLGFRDVAYFSRVFKKVTGQPPREFVARGAR
jgi:AraC-like DNA-binding protein